MTSRKDLKEYIDNYHPTPVFFPEEELLMAFGFERKSGLEILMAQAISPSRTEMDICRKSRSEKDESINKWCQENDIHFIFDHEKRGYIFGKKQK